MRARRVIPVIVIGFLLACFCVLLGLTGSAYAQKGGGKKLALSVNISPNTIAEGDVATGTVSHNNSDTSSAVTVSLASSDTTEATVPAEVVIPAGDSSADFTITGVSDGLSDGDQLVTVSATADGYRSANANLTVTDPVVLPNVRYTIEAIPHPGNVWINGLTNSRLAHGWYGERNAWVYDQVTGLFYALNEEATLVTQVNDLVGPGWTISSIVGMNDRGDMVGSLRDAAGNRKGIVIDASDVLGQFSVDPADWVVDILPDFGSNYTYGRDINQNGDVLGTYQRSDETWDAYLYNPWLDTAENPMPAIPLGINLKSRGKLNNRGQIAGIDEYERAFIYHAALDQWTWFIDAFYQQIDGLNDHGVFAGVAYTIETYAGGKKQRRGDRVAFRQDDQFEALSIGFVGTVGDAINNSGDVGYWRNTEPTALVAHTGFAPDYANQTLTLAELIADDDPLRATFIDSNPEVFAVNDRDDATGYGQVVCRLYFPQPDGSNQTQAVILTPAPAP